MLVTLHNAFPQGFLTTYARASLWRIKSTFPP